jgi:hypothetical protein
LLSVGSWVRVHLLAAACGAAVLLTLGAALPAVWREPLHVDEQVTLAVSPRSFGAIIDEVSPAYRPSHSLPAICSEPASLRRPFSSSPWRRWQ